MSKGLDSPPQTLQRAAGDDRVLRSLSTAYSMRLSGTGSPRAHPDEKAKGDLALRLRPDTTIGLFYRYQRKTAHYFQLYYGISGQWTSLNACRKPIISHGNPPAESGICFHDTDEIAD
jgi:hypothetical protein